MAAGLLVVVLPTFLFSPSTLPHVVPSMANDIPSVSKMDLSINITAKFHHGLHARCS